MASALINAGADVNRVGGGNWTPLSMAANKGHADIVSMLIKAGADSTRALNIAAYNGRTQRVDVLLKAGVDVNSTDKKGDTPLPLLHAAYKGHSNVVRVLLAAGADSNQPDNTGRTPADWAGQEGYKGITHMLRRRTRGIR